MRRTGIVILLICTLAVGKAQIVADHTVVDQYDDIPQEYMDLVKTMLVSIPGESHSVGYRLGQNLLEMLDSRFQVETYVGTPPSPTDQRLRLGMHRFGGEYLFFNTSYYSELRNQIYAQNNSGNPFHVMGFGWCYDMSEDNPPGGTEDPVYQVRWAGRSVEGPDGNRRWGLDSGDQALTGNRVNMDTYLQWVESMIRYCNDNSIPTQWIFTTGPVDKSEFAGTETGFQREIKQDYIRDYVAADASRILFDYADILCWSNSGEQHMVNWNDGGTMRPHAQIHPDNMLDYDRNWNRIPYTEDGDHIGEVGALRLAKAMWWMLARIAGWQSEVPVSDIQIYASGDLSVVTGQTLQLLCNVLPAEATDKQVTWSVIQGSGTATITQAGVLRGGIPGEVRVVATARDGSGVADTLTVPVLDPLVPVSSISVSTQGGAGSVLVGESLQCFASVLPSGASNTRVLWSILNLSGSASITSNGLVTGVTAGNIRVIATAEDGSQVADTIPLSISEGIIYVTDIVISSSGGATEVVVGADLQFSAAVLPGDATNPSVDWSVINDAGSASISSQGLLRAGNPGGVRVVATAADGSAVADTFSLTVIPPAIPVESIAISSAGGATSVESGLSLQFSAAVLPAGASNPRVVWSVVNGSGSATITSTGILLAGNPGTVEVVAAATDGSGVTDNFSLEITPPVVLVENISISSAGGVTSVESGSTLQFTARVLPADATNPDVAWSRVNGTGSASISPTGLLTAGNPGTVTVVARAVDGSEVSDAFNITVTVPEVLVERIEIIPSGGATSVESGSTLQFSANVIPNDATNPSIDWSVINDAGSAAINAGGLLTAYNPGTVRVRASATDGSGITEEFLLSITAPSVPVTGIEVSAEGGRTWIESGLALRFYAAITPGNASNQNVEWRVNAISGTAFIEADGTLLAGNPGQVEVVARARDGSGVSGSYMLSIQSTGIKVLSIEVHSEGDVSLVDKGQVLQLYAVVNPSNASIREVFWHVSGSNGTPVGSITSEGLFIALDKGEAEVLAIAKDGSGVYDSFSLTVMGPSGTDIPVLEGLNIYPNPGKGLFYVNTGELNGGLLKVIDAKGALVFEHLIEPGVQVIELDLTRHTPGIYYIHISDGRHHAFKPVILSE